MAVWTVMWSKTAVMARMTCVRSRVEGYGVRELW
jgi:hypothetical protein